MRRSFVIGLLMVGVAACGGKGADTPAPNPDASAADASPGDLAAQDVADTAASPDVLGEVNQSDSGTLDVPGTATFETADPQRVTVMTYNFMCSFCVNKDHDDWEHKWAARVPWLHDVLVRHDADLVGLQEAQGVGDPIPNEIEQLILPESSYAYYYYHWVPGDPLEFDYPDAAVLWRKARFDKLATGQFWLSPTPDVAFSSGFAKGGAQFPRVVVWVLLHDKQTNKDFYFANTHFDNNAPSQTLSAPLSLDVFGKMAVKHPVIFVGDFNASPEHEAYKILTQGVDGKGFHFQNALDLAKTMGFLTNVAPLPDETQHLEAIDHVFLGGATFDVTWWVQDFWRYGKLLQAPSDHDGAIVTSVRWQ